MPSDTLRSLTARRIQTLLCYASSSCYYLTYPTVMDFFLHAPYIRSLLFYFIFFHSLTHVPQAGLVGGFRKDCRYSSSLFLFYGIFSFFLALVTIPRIIIRYPCFALKKNLPLEVAPFIFFS